MQLSVSASSDSILEFSYDPENNATIDIRYKRYESVFPKVRLLTSKLTNQDFEQFANSFSPKKPHDFSLNEGVEKLKSSQQIFLAVAGPTLKPLKKPHNIEAVPRRPCWLNALCERLPTHRNKFSNLEFFDKQNNVPIVTILFQIARSTMLSATHIKILTTPNILDGRFLRGANIDSDHNL
uniref:DUF7083 domain-containing protein n=1 Tax=Megaselia scalaris TaxID=36166 RepID=T1GZN3_MEGSC